MWLQRSSVRMHSTSLLGVSLTRFSQPVDDCARAPDGPTSAAASASDITHQSARSELTRGAMNDPSQNVCVLCGALDGRPVATLLAPRARWQMEVGLTHTRQPASERARRRLIARAEHLIRVSSG